YFANQESPSLPTGYSYEGSTYNLAAMVSGVSGLMTYNGIHTMSVNQSQLPAATGATSCQIDCSAPLGYSPQQIDSAYNVPTTLTGKGTTIAIATLAPFYNKDANAFWTYYKIKRTGSLSQVSVDGAPTDTSGAGQGGSESSLDVERSGAMAPGANIVAYIAPNTNNGFVDLFNTVATENTAQVMTTSWGLAEQDETQGYATLLNQAFEQGAAEGISMFAASGDYGAYDGYPQYKTLAVDSPASSTYITAAGGTTLPQSSAGVALAPGVNVGPTTEVAWGWSYLVPYYQLFGEPNQQRMQQLLYPIGSGGGYSLYFQEPSWQTGFQTSGQRGLPDVALNADPFTGYAIYDSSSVYSNSQGPWSNGWGGTSFAAPLWAGITALLDQATGGPIGLATGVFYHLPASGGTVAGFRDITQGNNWGYQAGAGWDPTTGLGVPDVGQLAAAISAYDTPTATKTTGKR
ncbi:MAG: S53 family peptidase, partial [Candidatus Dormibacteria bacterium]